MSNSEKGLRLQQEHQLAKQAREALNNGQVEVCLELLARSQVFLDNNLVCVLGVFCTRPNDSQRIRAQRLVLRFLQWTEDPKRLDPVAQWLLNPKRNWLSPELLRLVEIRRRELEPSWNGIWGNGGRIGQQKVRELFKKNPRSIFDPEECLIVASQVSDFNPWLQRFLTLGGDPKDPKYLKIRISKAALKIQPPTARLKEMLQDYCATEKINDLRRFLRNLTPTKSVLAWQGVGRKWSRLALLTYCTAERIPLVEADWVHIARCSLILPHTIVQRLAYSGLAAVERSASGQQLFEQLQAIHGYMPVVNQPMERTGRIYNSYWEQAHALAPVDANARSILISYVRAEIKDI